MYLGPPPNHPGKVFCHRGHQTPMGHIAHPSKIGHNKISFMKHKTSWHRSRIYPVLIPYIITLEFLKIYIFFLFDSPPVLWSHPPYSYAENASDGKKMFTSKQSWWYFLQSLELPMTSFGCLRFNGVYFILKKIPHIVACLGYGNSSKDIL